MPPSLLIILALAGGAVALYWMWTRVRRTSGTSADDYVAQAKQQARADLGRYLRKDGRPKR